MRYAHRQQKTRNQMHRCCPCSPGWNYRSHEDNSGVHLRITWSLIGRSRGESESREAAKSSCNDGRCNPVRDLSLSGKSAHNEITHDAIFLKETRVAVVFYVKIDKAVDKLHQQCVTYHFREGQIKGT